MNKYDVIMFTGMDRCGKTTARKLFAEHTKQKFITWDRSFVDNFAYDEVFRTAPDISTVEDIVLNFKKTNPTIVYLKLNFEEINRRTFNTEGFEYEIKELSDCENAFAKYLAIAEGLGIRIELVDCNNKTPMQIVEEICERIG